MRLPKRVTIELTNRCNRKCAGCPRERMDYPVGDMSITMLTNITEQLPESTVVVPFYRGEPTLHHAFPQAMRLLSKFRTVQLASNGDFLSMPIRKQASQAILGTCTFVSLSLHEFIRPEATRWLGFLYDCLGRGVETQVSIVDALVEEKYKDRFIREWKQHADRVRIYKAHSQAGFGNMGTVCNDKCAKPFEEMVIYWDGYVGLCNHDWNNLFPLGKLSEKTIAQIWNGTSYAGIRDLHESGLRRAVPTCEFCSFKSNETYGELIKTKGEMEFGRPILYNKKAD